MIRFAATFASCETLPSGQRIVSLCHPRLVAEAEVRPRVRRREVAAAVVELLHDRWPFGSVAVSTAPAWKPFSETSSQWPTGPVSSSSTSGPPIVLIAIAIRPLLSKSAGARPRPMIFGSPVRVDDPASRS